MGYKEPPQASRPDLQWQLFVFNQVGFICFLLIKEYRSKEYSNFKKILLDCRKG